MDLEYIVTVVQLFVRGYSGITNDFLYFVKECHQFIHEKTREYTRGTVGPVDPGRRPWRC